MAIRVLVVDDDQEKASSIVELLARRAGIDHTTIEVAGTGVDARRALAEKSFDLVVIDIALPLRRGDQPDRRGGIKLLEEMVERGVYKLPEVVVGLTGFPDLWNECSGLFRSRLWTLELYDRSDMGWAQRLTAKARYLLARSEQCAQLDYGTDVCVMAALHTPELSELLKLPWEWSDAMSFDQVGFYYEGLMRSGASSRSIVAAAAPRMGMVAASILSTKMIAKFRPRVLAMVGICGGVRGSCKIGDALVADPSWDWQMGKHDVKGFRVAPDHIGIATGVAERFKQLAADKKMLFDIHEDFPGTKPGDLPNILVGPVTCGSAVLGNSQLLNEIKASQHRKLLGVDMELYGMYTAVRDAPSPAPVAIGVKGVCDYADKVKGDDYQAYAAHVSARVFAAYLKSYGHVLTD